MSETTPHLSLPYILPSQAQKHVTHNEAIRALDALVQLAVLDRDRTEAPPAPVDGQRHIVATGATGAWAGADGKIAAHQDGAWAFYAAERGWRAFIDAEQTLAVFDGGGWIAYPAALTEDDFQNLGRVGVNTTADTTNRLASAAAATLLTHEGGGHQLKINKNAAGDTASLLFQTGWTGRAEMGTAGSDAFSIKVSADGAQWAEALSIEPATGKVTLAETVTSPSDVVARRFIAKCADFPYLVTNIDNQHPSPVSTAFEFQFAGIRRYAFGANESSQSLAFTAYDAAGTWKGSPLVIEYAGAGSMNNALYIDAERNIGIGKVPDVRLDVAGVIRLEPTPKASLPAPTSAGSGTVAFVSDATGGPQLAYSDGSAWLKVRDGLAV